MPLGRQSRPLAVPERDRPLPAVAPEAATGSPLPAESPPATSEAPRPKAPTELGIRRLVAGLVGLELPVDAANTVLDVQKRLSGWDEVRGLGLRFVPACDLHVSLRFVDSLAAEGLRAAAAEIARQVAGTPPFRLSFGRLALVPQPAAARALWLLPDPRGPAADPAALLEPLRALVDEALRPYAPLGVTPDAPPHVTLALLPAPTDATAFGIRLEHSAFRVAVTFSVPALAVWQRPQAPGAAPFVLSERLPLAVPPDSPGGLPWAPVAAPAANADGIVPTPDGSTTSPDPSSRESADDPAPPAVPA